MPQAVAFLGATLFTIGGATVTVGGALAIGASVAVQISNARSARRRAENLARAIRQSHVPARPEFNQSGLSVQQVRDLTVMIKEPIPSRRIVYGRQRVGGIWIFPEVTGSSNEFMHMVLGLSEGPIEEIESIYFGDDEVTIDPATGNATDTKFAGYVRIQTRLGDASENESSPVSFSVTPASDLINAPGHGLSNGAVVSMTSTGTLPAGLAAGQSYFVVSATTDTFKVSTTKGGSAVDITGSGTGTRTFIHYPGAYGDLINEATNWTHRHKCKGIATMYVRLKFNVSRFPNGIPHVSVVLKGRNDIYDPRDASTGYSDNAALCLANYLATSLRGPAVDFFGEIDQDALNAAANICDDDIDLLGGGTEKRYTFNGAIDLEENPEDNANKFATAMAGQWLYANGKFQIIAGAYTAPTFEITEDMLAGPVKLRNVQPKRDRQNTIKGTYIDEDNAWQKFSFPSVSKPSYVEEDGETLVRDLNLTMVKSAATAQRLANILLEESRLEKTLDLRCKLSAFPAQAGKNVMVTIARLGFAQTPFRVLDSTFGVGEDGSLTVDLALVRTDPGIYNWAVTDEQPINIPPDIAKEKEQVDEITATPSPGIHSPTDFPLSITLSTLTSGASIRWSRAFIPGTSGDGEAYAAAIPVSSGETIYARAFKTGLVDSNAIVAHYTNEKVETPNASPAGGAYPAGEYPKAITLSTLTSGASIRYSTAAPVVSDTDGTAYTVPVSVNAGETLYFRAFKTGLAASDQVEETYTAS